MALALLYMPTSPRTALSPLALTLVAKVRDAVNGLGSAPTERQEEPQGSFASSPGLSLTSSFKRRSRPRSPKVGPEEELTGQHRDAHREEAVVIDDEDAWLSA